MDLYSVDHSLENIELRTDLSPFFQKLTPLEKCFCELILTGYTAAQAKRILKLNWRRYKKLRMQLKRKLKEVLGEGATV